MRTTLLRWLRFVRRAVALVVALWGLRGGVAAAQSDRPMAGTGRSGWYNYFGDHMLSPTWGVHLEGQWRRDGTLARPEQLLLRTGVDTDYGHGFTSLLAYTYLLNYPFPGGGLEGMGAQPEHRVLEELQFKHRVRGVKLSHRLRAEQRFEGTRFAGGRGVTDWEFAERARYRFTAAIMLPKRATGGLLPDYLSLYNEIFVNFGPHGTATAFNQNRTYGAPGWNAGPYFSFELGYLHQQLPQANGVTAESNNSVQFVINSTAPFRRGIRKKR